MSYKFKGVFVVKDIWTHKNLTANKKFLLAEIEAMSDGEYNPCYATNSHFAKQSGLKIETIRSMIAWLDKHGYLKRKYKDGDYHSTRYLWIDLSAAVYKEETPIEIEETPIEIEETPIETGTIKRIINTPIREEEVIPISLDEIRDMKQYDFINLLRENFRNRDIPIKDVKYYFNEAGFLLTNKVKIADGLAKGLYKYMYKKRIKLIKMLGQIDE